MSDLLGYLYGVIAVGICMIPGGILVYLLDKKGYQEGYIMVYGCPHYFLDKLITTVVILNLGR